MEQNTAIDNFANNAMKRIEDKADKCNVELGGLLKTVILKELKSMYELGGLKYTLNNDSVT